MGTAISNTASLLEKKVRELLEYTDEGELLNVLAAAFERQARFDSDKYSQSNITALNLKLLAVEQWNG